MSHQGDYQLEDTIHIFFTTRAFATGIPTVLAGTPLIDIYEDGDTTQVVVAESLTVDFDTVVGLNLITITATAASGFEAGKSYTCIIEAGTVATVSVIGEVVGHFTIQRAGAAAAVDLANATDGLTALAADIAAVQSDTDDLQTQVGTAGAGLTAINLPNQTMDITGNVTGNLSGSVGSVTGAVGSVSGNVDGSTASVTGAVGSVTGAVGSVTGNVDGNVTGSVGSLAAQAITDCRSLTTGTADAGGTTTTMRDAALTEADDYWNGQIILFTSGGVINQARLITDFDATNDDITFAPPADAAIGAGITYEILPFGNENDEIFAEMAQGAPAATPTKRQAIMWLFMALRNLINVDSNSNFKEFTNDAGTVIWKKATTDAGNIYTEAEGETGP